MTIVKILVLLLVIAAILLRGRRLVNATPGKEIAFNALKIAVAALIYLLVFLAGR